MNSIQVHQNIAYQEETMDPSVPAKILIGLPLDADVSKELLLWAIRLVARPNDTVIALHVLVKQESKKLEPSRINQTRLRRAKAFVISALGEFVEICLSKQVNLEAKVGSSSSVGKGLIEDAEAIGADFLLIGGSRNRPQSSLETTKYCFEHAPEGCSVVSIGKRGQPHQDSSSESMPSGGLRQSSLRRQNSDAHLGKTMSPMQKLFGLKRGNSVNRTHNHQLNHHSRSASACEEPSPRAVLDGPEGGSHDIEDGFSFGDSSITESPPLAPNFERRSKTWKRLLRRKLLFPFFCIYETQRKGEEGLSDKENQKPSWRCFSYEEISNATNNFHPANMVGRGGFAEVYRGDLCDGRTIAVKRLTKENNNENKEKEFLMELGIIGHVFHPNTTYLIGCCIENGLHLIFNFSPNGTLASALHGSGGKILEWPVRYKIAVGVARGLHYLHKCCKHRIIHRDIKASNVLLGSDFEPQISDFGLAKWLPTQWTHHSVIPVEGTFGYLAPEYFMHGIVDEKTDVFAFGVLLLEIITGRRPVDTSKQSLLYWSKPLIESGNIAELADPNLGGKYDMGQMRRLVLTSSYCVRQSPVWRPSMSEVLRLLTEENHSEMTRSWRMTERITVDEMGSFDMDVDCWSPSSPSN